VCPTKEYYDFFHTKTPLHFTLSVVCIFFLITSMVFVIYDCFVQKRQDKVLTSAQQSNAIGSSLFPAQVSDRLLGEGQLDEYDDPLLHPFSSGPDAAANGGDRISNLLSTRPIADLFLYATVMFADISGFTAWASMREAALPPGLHLV
jgi:hypothetical protein